MPDLSKMGMRTLLTCAALLLGAASAGAQPRTFLVDAAGSTVTIHVGKAGLFKFAGHEHAWPPACGARCRQTRRT
jgi:hypothetical protein